MRVRVSSAGCPEGDENRAYAEYRIFTAIAPYDIRVRAADVTVRQEAGRLGRFLCTVAVDLAAGGCISARARAAHPVAAIDGAARRIARLVRRTARLTVRDDWINIGGSSPKKGTTS